MNPQTDQHEGQRIPKVFGDASASVWRIGRLQYFSLHIAHAMLLLAGVFFVIAGVGNVIQMNLFPGIFCFIAAPTAYGLSVTVGLAIEYVDRIRDDAAGE